MVTVTEFSVKDARVNGNPGLSSGFEVQEARKSKKQKVISKGLFISQIRIRIPDPAALVSNAGGVHVHFDAYGYVAQVVFENSMRIGIERVASMSKGSTFLTRQEILEKCNPSFTG